MKVFLLLLLAISSYCQNVYSTEVPLNFTYTTCDQESCTSSVAALTLDHNFRQVYSVDDDVSCLNDDGTWSDYYCPDGVTCAQNCGLVGLNGTDDYLSLMKITLSNGSGVNLGFATQSYFDYMYGSVLWLVEQPTGPGYMFKTFKMYNREFSINVDIANVPCGIRASVIMVSTLFDGGMSAYATNLAGALYGTGGCNNQCPQNMFVAGKATSSSWSSNGACCSSVNIFEGNQYSNSYSAYPCNVSSYYPCNGSACGSSGVCDQNGCGLNPYRLGNTGFYGPGSGYSVDTTKPFTVVMQFPTVDGTDFGAFAGVNMFYVQNGTKINFPNSNVTNMSSFSNLTNSSCSAQQTVFSDPSTFFSKGGLPGLKTALQGNMSLYVSLQDDPVDDNLDLDGTYPSDAQAGTPGIGRGPCGSLSGDPTYLITNYGNSTATFSNISYGTIGSTVSFGAR